MVDAVGATVSIWAMVASSLALLSTRFYIRLIRQRARLHPSDCLLSFVFLVILAESILTTISNWQEIQYLAAHPDFSRKIDVFVLGASSSMQENYLKRLYGVLFCNLVAVYAAKATILVFFYEVFPARLRAVLHFVTGLVLTTFLAGILATSFWCLPRRRMWDPTIIHSNDSCELRIVPSYNTLLFAMHTATMVAVVILPMVLLRWVPGMRGGEVAFALSTLGFGAGSVVCSIITFHFILRTSVVSTDPCIKHAATLTILADQSAVFWAATLSAFRVRGRRRKEAAGAGDGKGLVIEVESRFSVTVEIVSEWGHDWKDPWESGRLEHERMKVNTATANR